MFSSSLIPLVMAGKASWFGQRHWCLHVQCSWLRLPPKDDVDVRSVPISTFEISSRWFLPWHSSMKEIITSSRDYVNEILTHPHLRRRSIEYFTVMPTWHDTWVKFDFLGKSPVNTLCFFEEVKYNLHIETIIGVLIFLWQSMRFRK